MNFREIQAYLDNVEEYKDDMVDNFYNQWITNFTLGVDTFLVLSATLTAFTWFKRVHRSSPGMLQCQILEISSTKNTGIISIKVNSETSALFY